MTETFDPDRELTALTELIVTARDSAAARQSVDLGNLAARTERLCGHLTSSPPAVGRPYAERLKKLVKDLDDLSAAIESQFLLATPAAGPHPATTGNPA